MKHLDEATILTFRDGGGVDDAAREHLEGCATCAAALASATARVEVIERTLAALDGPIEATAAKAGVRARLRSTEAVRAQRWGGRHLGRAAAMLLIAGGAAAALPGSPVTSLWNPPPSTSPEPLPAGSEVVETPRTPFADPAPAGIAVGVEDGFVLVVVRGADPGTELSVTWTDQPSARLNAPPGSRFTYSAGRVEVDASRGPLHIELPRNAGRVSLQVDGRSYLTGSFAALELPGPVTARTDDLIRFRVDDR
jgi:hypothetical protein